MTLAELVNETFLAYRGKLTNVPTTGSEKYSRILYLINRNQRQWALDSNVDWPSRYEIRTIGTTSTGTQSYDLDDDIVRLSDYVQLVPTTGSTSFVTVIKPQATAGVANGCYISGNDPKQITFLTDITASNTGRSIVVPCFTMPDDLVSSGDTVAVDNPQWLIYATAAELARNDPSKEDGYGNLQGIANDLYQNMVNEAESSSFLQPNGVPNNMSYNAIDSWSS